MKRTSENLLVKGIIKLFFIIFPSLLLSAFLGYKIPILLKKLSLNFDDTLVFKSVLLSVIMVFIATYFNRVIYQLVVNKYVKLLVQDLRLLCFKKWIHAYEVDGSENKNTKDHYPQGEVITRILNDTESIRELITSGTFGILIDAFFVISCLISFISINSTLGWALTVVEVLVVVLLIKGSKVMRVVFLEVSHSRGRVSKTMANLMGGIRETYFTSHMNYASKKGHKVFDEFLSIQLKANMWDAIYYSMAESLYPILLAFMVLVFPYSKITHGAVILVIIDLIQRSISPIKDIAGKISNVQRALAGAIRINDFSKDLEKLPSSEKFSEVDDQVFEKEFLTDDFEKINIKIKEFSYPLRFDSTSFSLNDINFTASASKLYGIVGTSGCGKSTLFNIMAAKIYPTKGSISLEFKGNKKIIFPSNDTEDWRRYRMMIGLVGQDSHIFSDSIRFNLTLGARNKRQDIEDFFEKVTNKISYISEWGVTLDTKVTPEDLSAGQKQLLAALRALYWRRPVILFDEISSALDSRLEQALRLVVEEIQKDSLVFIVAHRLETVMNSDVIIAMNNGKIEAIGSHSFLIEESDYYQNFVDELMHSSDS